MSDNNLKRLEKLVESIKEIVEITQNKVEKVELSQSVTSGQIRMIKDQQSVMNKKLDELKDIQDNRLLPSVTEIEMNIKAYSDWYNFFHETSNFALL